MLDAELLRRLLHPADPAVLVYLPLEPEQRDLRAPEARLRNLVDEVRASMSGRGWEGERCEAVCQAMQEAMAGVDLAAHRGQGLVLFARAGWGHARSLPSSSPAVTVVGTHFHIKPLLPLLEIDRRFNILALSKADVRLLSATPFRMEEVPLDALPAEAQAELDSRLAGEIASGQEDLAARRRSILVEDPARIVFAVEAALGAVTAPLVIVSDPHVAGNLLAETRLSERDPAVLHLNPFAVPDPELHARVLAMMHPGLHAERSDLLDRINARLGAGEKTVAIRLEEVLTAAQDGRVEALAVAEDQALWGRFTPGATVVAHGRQGGSDEDLLNVAAVLTLANGGQAFALPVGDIPRQVPAAAALRY
ncbi:MAG: hypothetical protein AB7S57_13225 [Acetobacteraceae bacterium]